MFDLIEKKKAWKEETLSLPYEAAMKEVTLQRTKNLEVICLTFHLPFPVPATYNRFFLRNVAVYQP